MDADRDYDNPYTGTFDGKGHAVTAVMSNTADYAGFFGVVKDATIQDLAVLGEFFGTKCVGGIVGAVQPGNGTTTITGCRKDNMVHAYVGNSGGELYSGGIVGRVMGKTVIENCENFGVVLVAGIASSYSGGICGYVDAGVEATIRNCLNTEEVSSSAFGLVYAGKSCSGGIIGMVAGGVSNPVNVTLSNNCNIGEVTATAKETEGTYAYPTGICFIGEKATIPDAGTPFTDCYFLAQDGLVGVEKYNDTSFEQPATVKGMTEEAFHSGEVASLLGEAFGQDLGDPDSYPVLLSFLSDEEKDKFKNIYKVTAHIDGQDDIIRYYNMFEQFNTWADVEDNKPVKVGYEFKGWSTKADNYEPLTALSGDTEIYAHFEQSVFAITVGTFTGGKVEADKQQASEGETVTLTVTPDANYKLETITVKDATGNEVSCTESGNGYTFPMPASAVTVTATFTPNLFDIAIGTFTGGTVAADKTQASAGETVTLTVTPASDYNLGTLTVTGATVGAVTLSGSGNTYTFVMPAEAVTVAATFSYDPPYVPSYYDLDIEPCEGVTLEANRETVVEGSSFTLTAEVAEGYDAESLVVEFKRGHRGTWKAVKADTQGRYRIGNVYTDIYVRATIAKEEDPTAVESVESDRPQIRAIGGRLCITLASPTDARICDLSGRLVRTARLSSGYNELTGLPAGLYIVLLSDGTRGKAVIN